MAGTGGNSLGNFPAFGQGGDLLYDLRVFYAYIVGINLITIAEARQSRNYRKWYDALIDLHTVTKHKIDRKVKKDERTFEELNQEVIQILHKNTGVFQGQEHQPERCEQVRIALAELEKFLYCKMDEAGLFGVKRYVEGLG